MQETQRVMSCPLTDGEVTALFHPLEKNKKIALAVSGGADSMALALCCQKWAGDRKIIAFIVNHNLRPESTNEAMRTGQTLSALGISSEILIWNHALGKNFSHAQARDARYQLLLTACHQHGCGSLLLGHHADDQAETILMRLCKGSGSAGLSGMAKTKLIDGVTLYRPFISIPKERLIATCIAHKIDFVNDPSNEKEKYARGRLRKIMPLLASEGLSVQSLTLLGDRMGEDSDALSHYTSVFLKGATQMDVTGTISLDITQLRTAPRAIALRALAQILKTIHPRDYGTERASILPLLLALCGGAPMPSRTLHGCFIAKNKNTAQFMREVGMIAPETPIKAGDKIHWDNRWILEVTPEAIGSFTLRPLHYPAHEILDKHLPNWKRIIPKAHSRASLPTLWQNNHLCALPALDISQGSPLKASLIQKLL